VVPDLKAVLNAALDCVVMMDHEGRIVGINPAAERTFGIAEDDARGREMAEVIIPPTMREAHRQGLKRFLEGGEPHVLDRRIEVTAQRADGALVPVELTITKAEVDGPPLFVGYLRDIGERIEAEEAVRRSRMQLLRATDEARRRLERDLHDGAQQRLVGLALTLRLARAQVERDPATAVALLDEAQEDLANATEELRELARGLHPAVLTDGGLGAALRGLIARLPLDVAVSGVPEDRLPIDVESTAYFVVAEGLTNVARYSGAQRAMVEFSRTDGRLVIEVRDHGRGGADLDAGTGLRGLAARVAVHDGTLSVTSPPGEGTIVHVEVPCGL
jgi:PAS domain S-box-containing protein